MRRLLAACLPRQLGVLHHTLTRPAITGQAVTRVGEIGDADAFQRQWRVITGGAHRLNLSSSPLLLPK